VNFAILLLHHKISVLVINSTVNGNNFSSFVGNETILVSEHLPPSGVDTRDGSEVVAVTIVLDIKAVVLPVVVSDSLCDFIKPELLLSLVVSPSLEDHVGSSEHLSDSVEWKF
jgi:hypothetical protein